MSMSCTAKRGREGNKMMNTNTIIKIVNSLLLLKENFKRILTIKQNKMFKKK